MGAEGGVRVPPLAAASVVWDLPRLRALPPHPSTGRTLFGATGMFLTARLPQPNQGCVSSQALDHAVEMRFNIKRIRGTAGH